MTAPAPKFLFTYKFTVRHTLLVTGNAKARTVQEVRDIIAKDHGPDAAELATINIASVEEATSE